MLLSLRGRRGIGAAVAVVTAATVVPLSLLSAQPATAATPSFDRTSPLEARRVDRVKIGKIAWSACTESGGECAEVLLPLD